MALLTKIHYRPEIDGLRAVAVGAVLLFHGRLGGSGGYLGVDVFFVISGFLITSLIWGDLESGRFTFSGFWERRARRIVPALAVVTLATVIAAWFFFLPEDFKHLGRATAMQAVFAANIHYWLDTGYFASAVEDMPLLHTWSLAVEEQYYLIVPLLLWGLYRIETLRTRRAILAILISGFVVSLAASIHGVAKHPSYAFYLLPSRAWELLLGSIVVFMPAASSWLNRRGIRELSSAAGLAMIVVPVFSYTSKTPFPGLAALPPCLGTALLIWSNDRNEGKAPTVVGALLSMRPVVFVGLISYSLYLVHWPLLAFANYLALTPVSLAQRLAIVAAAAPLAVASWRWVETPFRKRRLGASKGSMFWVTGLALSALLLAGIAAWATQGFPRRFPPRVEELARDKAELAGQPDLSIALARAGRLTPIGVRDSTEPTVLVWGDSHAMAALPAIDALLKERGIAGRAALHAATAPVLDWYMINAYGLRKDSIEYNDAVFSFIRDHHIPEVIIIAYWDAYEVGADDTSLHAALLATVRRLVAIGCRPWIMLDVPIPGFNVPKALSLSIYSDEYLASLGPRPTSGNELAKEDLSLVADIEKSGGRILDPKPRFLDPAHEHYAVCIRGNVLYCDADHLSKQGAQELLLPFLRDAWTFDKH